MGVEKKRFSRGLSVVSSKRLMAALKKAGGPVSDDFRADAIADEFADKGSTFYFCTAGTWQSVPGSD